MDPLDRSTLIGPAIPVFRSSVGIFIAPVRSDPTVLCAVAAVFFATLPKTRGRSLEKMEGS
jgi:hypothetical protein